MTVVDSETVLRSFYAFHLEAGMVVSGKAGRDGNGRRQVVRDQRTMTLPSATRYHRAVHFVRRMLMDTSGWPGAAAKSRPTEAGPSSPRTPARAGPSALVDV